MTSKQLFADVWHMGFDRNPSGDGDAEALFACAVNRAQETLAALFPLSERVILSHTPPKTVHTEKKIVIDAKTTLIRTCMNVVACAFSVSGKGMVQILRDSYIVAQEKFNCGCLSAYRFFPLDEAGVCRITVTSDSPCKISDLIFFSEMPAVTDGVRFGTQETDYALGSLVEGGISLAENPTVIEKPLTNRVLYEEKGNVLTLSNQSPCQLSLTILRTPRRFDADSVSPDVRADAVHLLPLLIASYLWLESDREKSLYYLSMYHEALSAARQGGRFEGKGEYLQNGW